MPVANERVTKPGLASRFKKVVEAEQAALQQGKSRSEALGAAFDRFYKGDIAEEVTRFYKEHGGLFTAEDLAGYEPIWAEPVHTTYRGYDVYSSPSTSRGGFEVTMQLNLIEGFDLKKLGHNSPEALHLVVESIKVAKADVYRYVADPKTTDLPVAGMLSKQYAAERRKLIDAAKAMAYPEPGDAGGERAGNTDARLASHRPARFSERIDPEGHTDSFSIVDKHGNAVACTPTHGSAFGTGVVAGSTGLTFNNGTRIGSTAPYPDHVNYARGGQIPILNNSPIIVLKDGRFVLAIGTPGGETIGQTQFQAVINVLDFGMEIQEAIAAPRMALVADPSFYKPGSSITVRVENRIWTLFRNKWVVYLKPPFGGPEQVLRYLGRYTHRVALSNHRLVSFADGQVTFRWRDSAHGNQQRLMSLAVDEFLRRFLLHLLPPRFIRIRYYGFLAHRKRAALLPLCRRLIVRVKPSRTIFLGDDEPARSGWDCPRCGGRMRVVERFSAVELRIRPPPSLAAA